MHSNKNDNRCNLAIETSGRVGSVAVGRGHDITGSAVFSADLRHAVELLPTIERLCAEAQVDAGDLDEVYVSAGPGSFTGLRIGITVARTIAWSTAAKVVRIPTLDVIAQNARDIDDQPDHLGVILDAKRKAVFAATFQRRDDEYVCTDPPAERDPSEFLASLPASSAITGEGVPYFAEVVERSGVRVLAEETFRARAEVVHRLGAKRATLGQYDEAATLIPIYVRRPEAEEVWERRHGKQPDEGDDNDAGAK
jgi:tRNA threonylcarbamoyladenosine biosynthesis protein TsaB